MKVSYLVNLVRALAQYRVSESSYLKLSHGVKLPWIYVHAEAVPRGNVSRDGL